MMDPLHSTSLISSVAATMPNTTVQPERKPAFAELDNHLRHGPRGQAEYHHGFEHCI